MFHFQRSGGFALKRLIFLIAIIFSWPALAYINPAVGGYWITFIVSALAIALFRMKSLLGHRTSNQLEFINSGKARVLQKLATMYDRELFLPMEILDRKQWEVMSKAERGDWLDSLGMEGPWIIRSSFVTEDLEGASNAGAFLSVKCDELSIESIEKVFSSNPRPDFKDEVFVQPFLSEMKKIGVLATRYPSAPTQAVIEYTEVASSGNEVTSGTGDTRVFYRFRDLDVPLSFDDPDLENLYQLALRMENQFCHRPLDVEFAVDSVGQLKILQVRPIPLPADAESRIPQIKRMLGDIGSFSGNKTDLPQVWSRMTDWNPAEILGNHPSPLAISLYEELLCRSQWSEQRGRLGYSRPSSPALLHTFCGQPYVDVRKSLYSFLPEALDSDLKNRILNAQLDIIQSNPKWHDRVEFDVSLTSSPLFPEMSGTLSRIATGLSEESKKKWLQELEVIHRNLCVEAAQLYDSISSMDPFQTDLAGCWSDLQKTAKQFVIASRCGFVAISRLQELEKKSGLSHLVSRFAGAAAHQSIDDWYRCFRDTHGEPPFLRSFSLEWKSPGQKWEMDPAREKRNDRDIEMNETCGEFLSRTELISKQELEFCFKGIYLREHIKRTLYQQIHHFFTWVEEMVPGDLPLDVELLTVEELFQLLKSRARPEVYQLMHRRRRRDSQRLICMPDYFSRQEDLFLFETSGSRGTFVGDRVVRAAPVYLTGCEKAMDLSGKVVLIERAEPGLDWIFSQNPEALITRFGGPNSHAAIRCFEKSIPALIGVGESCFFQLKTAKLVYLDPGNQRLETTGKGKASVRIPLMDCLPFWGFKAKLETNPWKPGREMMSPIPLL